MGMPLTWSWICSSLHSIRAWESTFSVSLGPYLHCSSLQFSHFYLPYLVSFQFNAYNWLLVLRNHLVSKIIKTCRCVVWFGFGLLWVCVCVSAASQCAGVTCENGGTCEEIFGFNLSDYSCQCVQGYAGRNCQHSNITFYLFIYLFQQEKRPFGLLRVAYTV